MQPKTWFFGAPRCYFETMLRSRARRHVEATAIALALAGCGDGRVDPRRLGAPTTTSSATVRAPAPPEHVVLGFLADLPNCDIDHRGLVLDGGTPALATRAAWTGAPPSGVTDVEHDGSTWARVAARRLDLTVTLTDRAPLVVAARGEGIAAKSAQVLIDDQPLGTLSFGRDQIRVASSGATQLPVDPGLHIVSLRFAGHAHDEAGFADLDWIRIGAPEDAGTELYGAPTLRDVVSPAAALGGVPHKSIALRAPGHVRCSLKLPTHARIRASVGLSGEGSGDAEIRVLADGKPAQVVETLHVESTAPKWINVDRSLAEYGSGIVTIELTATEATKGSRILFGDPEVVVPVVAAPLPPRARAVVVVVLDGVERGELPPWNSAPAPQLGNLTDLALSATVFERHRGPSTFVSAAVGTLLTGLPPREHGLVDSGARLSASETTIALVARDASVRTAMFTGVPTTFRAFGLGEAWEKFVEYAPSSGEPATAPIDAAAAWITDVARSPTARLLAVVHARGAHPPWDVRETPNLPPKDYAGLVEPRRAAQIFARLRKRKAREVLSEADRLRARALEALALGGQDRALGALVAALKTANLWDTTLFVVTGDVASGIADARLYGDGLDITEPLLTLPLYVHFPGGALGGKRVTEPTEMVDVAKTALGALGLSFSRPVPGRDLASVAAGLEEGTAGPQVATTGDRYSARWGDIVLNGHFPRPPAVCDLALDAACSFDRREVMPIAARAVFARMVLAGTAHVSAALANREPATLDTDTLAALSVWGSE